MERSRFPEVLRVGPGRYRLQVYPAGDFPVRVESPAAGARVVSGSELLRDPVVVLR